jgi:hypothetical protein
MYFRSVNLAMPDRQLALRSFALTAAAALPLVQGRGLDSVHVDNEFMFSCAHCFHKLTHKLSMYANDWAFVQVDR